MKHITNFFDVSGRNRGILKGIFILAILLTFNATNGWAQSYLGIDGGFEGTAIIDNSTNYTNAQTSKWVKNNTSTSIALESSVVRSGLYSLSTTNSTTTGRRIWSPLFNVSSTTSQVTIQYYRRVTSNSTNFQQSQQGISDGTTSVENLSGTYTTPSSTNTWEKITYTRTSATFTNIAGVIMTRLQGSGVYNLYIDDVAIYAGAADNTAPNAPTSPTIDSPTTNSLNISWTASNGGVDNGGYLVVRGTNDPTTTPNTNGIYAVGNTIDTKMIVVYQGTGTSFTDNNLSPNTHYFYRVYTYDKAYNYSSSVACNGTTSSTTKTVTFNPNGGSGSMSNQSSSSATTLTSNTFTRIGYIFTGWNTSSDGTQTSYADGASYDFSSDITLYAQWKSTDATLSSLNVSTGTLSPTFASGTTSYSTTVGNATSAITVTPTVNESHATITVNGTAVSSGTASGTIALAEGANTINVVVTAQDGTTQKTYSITVTRQAANSPELTASSISDFGNVCINTIPSPNSFNISASNLTSYITIGALNGFSYATEINGSYSSTLDLAPSSGNINQTIYVQFLPTAAQSYSGDITITGGGLSGTINRSVVAIGINSAPAVTTTSSASSVSSTSATLSGTLTDTGCQTVIAKGFCYGTTTNPDLSGSFTTETDTLSSTINNLSPNTTYHFRAYATSAAGTSYGSDALFTTSGLTAPTATTATQVSANGFTASWNAIGGATGYQLDISNYNNFSTSTTLAREGFENSTVLFTPSGGTYYNGNTGTGDLPSSSPYSSDGSYSYGVANGTATLISNNINTSTVINAQLSFRLASYSVSSTGNGADATDIVTVYVSPDGGTNYYSTARVLGASNAVWSYSNGSGIATTPYDGNSTPVDFQPSGGGTRTSDGYSTVTITGLPNTTNLKIKITLVNDNANERWLIDNFNILGTSASFVSGFNNLSIATTSHSISGLTPNSTYYYRVRATGGNSTSANSNVVTAITGLTSSVSTSTLPDCPTCNIVINNGGTLTVNSNKTFGSVSADPGANITINNGNTLTAPVTLQSNSSSTATLVDNNTSSAITATVQQYLSGKTGTNSRGWWYVASPVSNATAAVFIPNGSSNKFGYWDEATGTYPQITDNSTSLNRGQGYVFYNPGNDAIVNFSGTLNTGDVTVYPTRTGTTNGSRGFNLVGNPYPSYLDWEGATKTHIRNTIWYRTMGGSAMTFDTYDNSTGTPIKTGVGVYGTVSNFIPPMQAFWVKVDADGLALNEASVVFHNADRSHQDQSSTNNHLRAPSENTQQPSIVRLRVSNGVNRDEAILVANSITSDDTDSYDVPKMPVNNTEVPELFSLAGQEELVINYQNNFAEGKEIQLGFRPGKATDFSIQAAEFSNADNNLNVILKDNGTEYDLTNGEAYNFSADATPTNTRFSIVFRAAGAVTSAATQSFNKINTYCNQAKQLIIQLPAELSTASASICNAVGQTIRTTTLQAGKNTLSNMNDGVYLIKVRVNGQAVTRKVVVK